MIATCIRERLERDPFEPFIICASSVRRIVVARPELRR